MTRSINTLDSTYASQFADLDYDRRKRQAELSRQLAQNKIAYQRGMGDLRRGLREQVTGMNTDLMARGFGFSGVRDKGAVDLNRSYQRGVYDLGQQAGAGAATNLRQQMNDWMAYYYQKNRAMKGESSDRYNARNQAAPLYTNGGQ